MAVSTRLRGNAGLYLSLKKGAAAAVAFDDVKSWELDSEDKDSNDLTFLEAAAGTGAQWTLKLTALSSLDTGSLYQYLWANPGSDVVVTLNPFGAATPTTTKPSFQGTFNTGLKPGISNEAKAGSDATGADFEIEMKASTDVVQITA